MMNNPENLSKDRLKEELRRRGIPFSPAKGKDYYLSIYKQHFTRRSVSTRQRSEFSSDDEPFRQTAKASPREKKFMKVLNVDHFLKQLAPISDSELFRELKKHKVDAGPITGSTRSLYEKKLAKIMAEKAKGGVSASSSAITIASESDEEEFSSGVEEEETDQPAPAPRKQQKAIPKAQPIVKQRTERSSTTSYKLRSRPIPVVQQKPSASPTTKPPKAQEETMTEEETTQTVERPYKASWCSVWTILQVLLLFLSFVIGLIVFDYMRNDESRIVTWAQSMINTAIQ